MLCLKLSDYSKQSFVLRINCMRSTVLSVTELPSPCSLFLTRFSLFFFNFGKRGDWSGATERCYGREDGNFLSHHTLRTLLHYLKFNYHVYHHSLIITTHFALISLILAVYRTHVIHEPSTWPGSHQSLAAQWFDHPTGVQKVIGAIPVGNSEFFLCPTLVT